METKRAILARFVDFDVTPTKVLPWQPSVKSILAIIRLNFTFSTISLVNNSHRAIKVHVNKVQYCRFIFIGFYVLIE